jgi:ketosteroid isomerase-like protein
VSVRWLAAPLIVLAGLTGCLKQPAGHAPVTEGDAKTIAERAEASFTTGNVDAIMRQYANGAVMIDASNPTPSTDRKVQTGWASAFNSMKPGNYHVPDRHIQVVGPDAFISSGTEIFTVQAGSATPTVSARFTDVFQRQRDGSWKIVHEHVSMPPTAAGQP